jgi:urease accessory protein UreH
VLVAGGEKVLEHLHARVHPWVVKTWSKLVGEWSATCARGLAMAVTAASGAPVRKMVGGCSEEMRRELRKATVQSLGQRKLRGS